MKKQISLQGEVTSIFDGKRLDQAAAGLFSSYSRSMLKRWIEDAMLTVNGKKAKPKERVYAGDILTLNASLVEQNTVTPEAMSLPLVYEDDDILVINKPRGLVVHPGAGNYEGTLLNGLLHHYPFLEHIPRAGIVHRLDKETTGLMVVAKTLEAHISLVKQLQERKVKRQYVAIANGVMTSGGTVEQPMGRHPANRLKMAVIINGKPAVTHYRVIERFRTHTLLRLDLETGRTHQIRVHMSHLRYPLVGDSAYGAKVLLPQGAGVNLVNILKKFNRQALHAQALGLTHPVSTEYMQWQADWPEDFEQLYLALKEDSCSHENSQSIES